MEAAAALQLRLLQHPLMPHVLKAVANVHLPDVDHVVPPAEQLSQLMIHCDRAKQTPQPSDVYTVSSSSAISSSSASSSLASTSVPCPAPGPAETSQSFLPAVVDDQEASVVLDSEPQDDQEATDFLIDYLRFLELEKREIVAVIHKARACAEQLRSQLDATTARGLPLPPASLPDSKDLADQADQGTRSSSVLPLERKTSLLPQKDAKDHPFSSSSSSSSPVHTADKDLEGRAKKRLKTAAAAVVASPVSASAAGSPASDDRNASVPVADTPASGSSAEKPLVDAPIRLSARGGHRRTASVRAELRTQHQVRTELRLDPRPGDDADIPALPVARASSGHHSPTVQALPVARASSGHHSAMDLTTAVPSQDDIADLPLDRAAVAKTTVSAGGSVSDSETENDRPLKRRRRTDDDHAQQPRHTKTKKHKTKKKDRPCPSSRVARLADQADKVRRRLGPGRGGHDDGGVSTSSSDEDDDDDHCPPRLHKKALPHNTPVLLTTFSGAVSQAKQPRRVSRHTLNVTKQMNKMVRAKQSPQKPLMIAGDKRDAPAPSRSGSSGSRAVRRRYRPSKNRDDANHLMPVSSGHGEQKRGGGLDDADSPPSLIFNTPKPAQRVSDRTDRDIKDEDGDVDMTVAGNSGHEPAGAATKGKDDGDAECRLSMHAAATEIFPAPALGLVASPVADV